MTQFQISLSFNIVTRQIQIISKLFKGTFSELIRDFKMFKDLFKIATTLFQNTPNL